MATLAEQFVDIYKNDKIDSEEYTDITQSPEFVHFYDYVNFAISVAQDQQIDNTIDIPLPDYSLVIVKTDKNGLVDLSVVEDVRVGV